MEAARTSETSVDIQLRTRQYILEYSELNIFPFVFFSMTRYLLPAVVFVQRVLVKRLLEEWDRNRPAMAYFPESEMMMMVTMMSTCVIL
jgi:hypothetical protein